MGLSVTRQTCTWNCPVEYNAKFSAKACLEKRLKFQERKSRPKSKFWGRISGGCPHGYPGGRPGALEILEKQACRCGRPWPEGADVHDPKGVQKNFGQKIGNGPNTVSESTVSNTELSEFFGAHWVPGSELSEFLSVYYLCVNANSPSLSQNSPSLPQNSVSSLLRNRRGILRTWFYLQKERTFSRCP